MGRARAGFVGQHGKRGDVAYIAQGRWPFEIERLILDAMCPSMSAGSAALHDQPVATVPRGVDGVVNDTIGTAACTSASSFAG